MKNKKIIFILLLLFIQPVFAGTTVMHGTWVDAPFTKLLTQFGALGDKWIIIARNIAIVMVLFQIIWTCVQVAFGTMETRKAIVGNISKWCLFLVVMTFYPAANAGLLAASQQIARIVSSGWESQLGSNLQNYFNDLKSEVSKKGNEKSVIIALKQKKIERLGIERGQKIQQATISGGYKMITGYNDMGGAIEETVSVADLQKMLDWEIQNAQKELKSLQNLEKGDISVQTYDILNDIFSVRADSDGKAVGWKLVLNTYFPVEYVSPDMEQKSNGKKVIGKTYSKKANTISIISPDAVLKCVYLCSCIMWNKEWSVVNQQWIENQSEGQANPVNGMLAKALLRKFTIMEFPFSRIFEMVFCIILIVLLVICASVAVIQYMMGITEYIIISGAAIILVPFMLFDGLNDLAQRIITTLFQQVMKLVFCQLMMMFVVWCFMDLTENTVGSLTGMTIQTFVYGVFIALIGGAFVTNAPKMAQALVSGTPQMSMGEVAQMAAAYATTGHLAAKGANMVRQVPQFVSKAGRMTAHKATDMASQHSRSQGAREAAYDAAIQSGQSKFRANAAYWAAGAKQYFSDKGSNMKAGVKNWYNGTSGGGRGGSGGGGSSSYDNLNATGKNYTNTSYDQNIVNPKQDSYKGQDYSTADAHNKKYGESMHYEKSANGSMVATRKQTLGEHLKTQKDDAYQESLKRYRDYFAQKNKNNAVKVVQKDKKKSDKMQRAESKKKAKIKFTF